MLGEIQARCANPAVGHAVVDVETVRCAEVVAPVNAGGKDNVRNRSLAFLRKQRRQNRLRRAIEDHLRMLL